MLPASVGIEEIVELGADGVFLSNGPGDPGAADTVVELTRHALERRLPLFGICFGNQILSRALGLGTYKMRYGHRGINIPVRDHRAGAVPITAQNHGFALEAEAGEVFDSPFGRVEVSHTCPNDGTARRRIPVRPLCRAPDSRDPSPLEGSGPERAPGTPTRLQGCALSRGAAPGCRQRGSISSEEWGARHNRGPTR